MEKKYLPLADFFQNAENSVITLTFIEIETIMGQQLPNAAYLNSSWWKKTKAPFTHFEAWANAGYYVATVRLGADITFSNHDSNISETPFVDTLIVREIDANDARSFINLQNELHAQAALVHYDVEEMNGTVQSIRKSISLHKKLHNGTEFLCIKNGVLVGFLSIRRSNALQNKHVASIRIGTLNDSMEEEINNVLLNAGINWAKANSIYRLEAIVAQNNSALISTFKQANFEVEGVREKAYNFNGSYEDEVILKTFFNA